MYIDIINIILKRLKIQNKIGLLGERLAKEYFEKKGFLIVVQNYLVPKVGEIDFIAKKTRLLVFVEVKTRRAEWFGSPYEAVCPRKVVMCKRAAAYFIKTELENNEDSVYEFRFDVVSIVLTPFQIRHFENVY